jgi:D-arabinose 1-dehydrogenase-like Zn-dependent alcohol dehydrogenase
MIAVIGGSAMGVHAEIREILAFSAAHDTKPMIELFAMNGVNLALHRVRHNECVIAPCS